jgi:hypothetical protein
MPLLSLILGTGTMASPTTLGVAASWNLTRE